MAELGAGSNSGYPGALDTKQTFANVASPDADGNTRMDAEVLNDVLDALIKLETELGIDPAGSDTDLVTRLAAIDTAIAARAANPHALGGAVHTSATLAALNALISDATLIDTMDARLSDARTAVIHAIGDGARHSASTLAALNALVSDATLIDTTDARLSDARLAVIHALGDGARHSAATLAELNALVSDATLIDTTDARLSDARDPNAHTHLAADLPAALAYENEANVFTSAQTVTALLDAQQDVQVSGDISPAQITGDQNNYNPANLATSSVLRLSSDATRNITGLAGGADGRLLIILNIGSFAITLVTESASSTAGNRFAIGANITVGAGEGIVLLYDSTSSRWRAPQQPGGGGGGNVSDNTTETIIALWSFTTSPKFNEAAGAAPVLNVAFSDTVCKAWCRYNEVGTPAIDDDFNISGITDRATGDMEFAIDTDLPNATYAVAGIASTPTGGRNVNLDFEAADPTTAIIRLGTRLSNTATLVDYTHCSFIVFGGP